MACVQSKEYRIGAFCIQWHNLKRMQLTHGTLWPSTACMRASARFESWAIYSCKEGARVEQLPPAGLLKQRCVAPTHAAGFRKDSVFVAEDSDLRSGCSPCSTNSCPMFELT